MKRSCVYVFTFLCCLTAALCQTTGGSDPCSATVVSINEASGNVTLYGSTTGKGTYHQSKCVPGDSSPVAWYIITPETGKHVAISTCGAYTNFDTVLGVFTGQCDQLACVRSNDDGRCPSINYQSSFFETASLSSFDDLAYDSGEFGSDPSSLQWVSDGSQYYISVSGTDQEYGNFDFTVIIGENRSGCPSAKQVPGPYTNAPVIINATIRADETVGSLGNCHYFDFGLPAVWFQIFPELNKQLNVSTCSTFTNFDTRMAILSGDCTNVSCDYENDDEDCPLASAASSIQFYPTKSSYYVLVTNIAQNPNCLASIPLTVGVSGTPEASTATLGTQLTSSTCGDEQGLAVWFHVYSHYSDSVTFNTCNDYTNFDTVLSFYGGNCDALTCITQNDDGCASGSGSSITVQLQSKVSYFLVVSGANGATGDFKLLISN